MKPATEGRAAVKTSCEPVVLFRFTAKWPRAVSERFCGKDACRESTRPGPGTRVTPPVPGPRRPSCGPFLRVAPLHRPSSGPPSPLRPPHAPLWESSPAPTLGEDAARVFLAEEQVQRLQCCPACVPFALVSPCHAVAPLPSVLSVFRSPQLTRRGAPGSVPGTLAVAASSSCASGHFRRFIGHLGVCVVGTVGVCSFPRPVGLVLFPFLQVVCAVPPPDPSGTPALRVLGEPWPPAGAAAPWHPHLLWAFPLTPLCSVRDV